MTENRTTSTTVRIIGGLLALFTILVGIWMFFAGLHHLSGKMMLIGLALIMNAGLVWEGTNSVTPTKNVALLLRVVAGLIYAGSTAAYLLIH